MRNDVYGSLSVKSHLTSGASVRPETTQRATEINGVFSETASFKSYAVICLPTASYSDIAAVFCAAFRRQSFLKLFKRLTVV